MCGPEAVAESVAFETANMYEVEDLVEREALHCDFHLTRAVNVYLDPEYAMQTEEAYRKLVKSGVANLDDTAFVPGSDA